MSDSQEMILYYTPSSSFSQKVAIALNYLNLKFEQRIINLFECEQLEPWYLDINPKGEVPTLKDGELNLADSADILQYLNDTYDTRRSDEKLIPNPVTPLGRQVTQCGQTLGTVKLFVLTFGAAFYPQHTRNSSLSPAECEGRKGFVDRCLKAIEEKSVNAVPPYKESYTYKLTKLATGRAMLKEESTFVDEIESTKTVLRKMDDQVAQSTGSWLFSDFPTVADVTLAVILFRIRKLGLEHHYFEDAQGQPALQRLAAYRDRAFEQPYMKGTLC